MAKVAPHPTRNLAIGSLCLGGAASVLGVTLGQPAPIVFGAVLFGYGAYLGYIGPTVQRANLAGAAINRGDMAEARAWIAEARARRNLAAITRLLDSHESEIAWREGDLEATRRHADAGLARKDLLPLQREIFRSHLAAVRALACAASGDDAAAEQSIAAVRANPRSPSGPLARVELAEALLLARRSDLNGLHRQLGKHHVLLCEALDPRGRALHRALRRMSALRATSAYRVPVKHELAAREGGTRSWMGRVFPQGQEHVDLDDAAPPEDALAAPADAQEVAPLPKAKRSGPTAKKALALWAVLIVMFVAIWSFFAEAPQRPIEPRPPSSPADYGWTIALGTLALLIVVVAFAFSRGRRKQLVLEEAARALACGELDRAASIAGSVRDDQNMIVAASASLTLASVYERRARFAEALAECDRGLGQLTSLGRTGASDVLLPQLVATRAYLFGALGREAESDGELARLAKDFPAFPYAAGWVLRTRLLRAVRRGDLSEARELAKARGDVAVGAQVELVAELAQLEASDDRDERIASIREDIALIPQLEHWVRTAAPGYLEHALPRRTREA